jgi:hypothetical protein
LPIILLYTLLPHQQLQQWQRLALFLLGHRPEIRAT